MTEAEFEAYLEHLAGSDRSGAIQLASSLVARGTPVEEVIEQLVCGAQVEVGRRWERNEWSVAQEHAATAVSEAVLHALLGADSPDESRDRANGKLVAVCAEGEWHTLALRVVSEVVRRAGWELVFLGPSVPASQLGRYLHDVGPDGLLVSCSVSLNLPGARRLIEATRATGTPVLAGGQGFGRDGRRAVMLGANAWAPDAATAVEQLRSWDRFTTPAAPLTHAGFAEFQRIDANTEEFVGRAMDALGVAFPPVRLYTGERLERTLEDLRFLLRFLAAALLVDDPMLLVEYVDWLRTVLTSRGLPPSVVPATLDAVISAVGPELPGAVQMLQRARAMDD